MFLRCSRRVKDGKTHEYWNLVENRRLADGRVAQRQVLYLGEMNASQREVWRKTIGAMGDLLDSDFALAEKNALYRCRGRLVEHKDDLFKFLRRRWGELFGAKFDVLLYDLTGTCFETDVERGNEELRQFGYSRDRRGDCRQVVIALIVTPEGFPLSCEVLAGNTADSTTLSDFLERIEQRYGRANRIWVMDRGGQCRRLRRCIDRLRELQRQTLTRDELQMNLGAAQRAAGRAANLGIGARGDRQI